jgi:quercetin dioxygenase-like cupin family protein
MRHRKRCLREPNVSEKAYEVAHLDDLDRYPLDDEGLLWRPVRRRLGITAFGTNAFTAEKGTERVVEEHYEKDGHEELYFVASGRATFVLGDEEIDAPAGTFVHAEPGTKRGAVATEPNTTVLAIGAKPGVPHEISKPTPREQWLDVDDDLAAELRERLAKLGYEGDLDDAFIRWTWKEALEDRVDGIEQVDPVVLKALRSRT